MITSRIMTNRMASPLELQNQPRGTATSRKASDFKADTDVKKTADTVAKAASALTPVAPAPKPAAPTSTPASSNPAPAASVPAYAVTPFNQFAGLPYTPVSIFAASPDAGKTTSSGAPDIKVASQPVENAWNYTGPAAKNPYFMTTGSVPDPNAVKGFANWFSNVTVYSGVTNGVDHYVNRTHSATAEGAQEALRLVQMYEPGAKLESVKMGQGAGPYLADGPTYNIVLPNGQRMNAGAILNSYYHGGSGVSVESDLALAAQVNAVRPIVT